jgi:hypothetical protein
MERLEWEQTKLSNTFKKGLLNILFTALFIDQLIINGLNAMLIVTIRS